MQDVVLLAAMTAIFVFGRFLVGKLGFFLEENYHAQELPLSSELSEDLSTDRSDVIFLPENTEISAHIQYNSKVVSLNCTQVILKCNGLPHDIT